MIHAGAGNDHVSSRRFDYARLDAHTLEISPIPLLNTIDLGSGNDSAEILLSQGDTLVLDGGTGIDFAHLDFSRLTTADVTFTLSAAVKLVDASVTLRHIEAVHITGNSGNNSFTGGNLDDIFQGGSGDDTIAGGKGNDTLYGEDGNDTLEGGEGNDFIVGGPVPPLDMDVFHTEEFIGEYSDEDWEKYEDDDIIYGGAGNDRIEDYLGANLIDAGAGDDVVTASHFMYTPAWQDPLIRHPSPVPLSDTVDLGPGNDRFIGMLLPGDALALNGGGGIDRAELDFSRYTTGLTFTVSKASVSTDASITMKNIEMVTLVGGSGKDRFNGHTGKDTFDGGRGNDILDGGAGSDYLQGGEGKGSDKIFGGAGNDSIGGGDGNDKLYGGKGNDAVYGEGGNDILDGGTGRDILGGGSGQDTYFVDNVGDKVGEQPHRGTDLVNASVSYTLTTNIENLTLTGTKAINGTGNSAANTITGNAADNVLKGGRGNDVLISGKGADDLYGGKGADTFVFKLTAELSTSKSKTDTIFDFSRKEKDLIDLTGIDAATTKSGNQAFAFIGTDKFSKAAGELRYVEEKANTYVYGDTDGDGKANFVLHFDDALKLTKADFLL